eukprot:GEMP01019524.1.p1 GENE.GEMP01019524.1~~GEMP01019524.1.p1  ORF type:complete len:502 (+),score=165.30 GEMP01019524.1:131-1636(+)
MDDIFGKPDDAVVTLADLELDEDSPGGEAMIAALGECPWIVADVKKWLSGTPTVPKDSILHPLMHFVENDMDAEQLTDFLSIARQLLQDTTGDVQFLLSCVEKVANAVQEPHDDVEDIGVLDPSFQRRKNAALLNQVTALQEQVDELSVQNGDLQDKARHNAAAEKRLAELEELVRTTEMQRTHDAKEIECLKGELNKNREAQQRLKHRNSVLESDCDSKEQMIDCLQRNASNDSALGMPHVKATVVSRGVVANLTTVSQLFLGHSDTARMLYLQLCFTTWTLSVSASKAGNKGDAKLLLQAKETENEKEREVWELKKEVERLKDKERTWDSEKNREKQEWERREWELKRDFEREKERTQDRAREHMALKMECEKRDWQQSRQCEVEQNLGRELAKSKEELQRVEQARLQLEQSMGSMKNKETVPPLTGWSIVSAKSLHTDKNRQFVLALQQETKQMKKSSDGYVRIRRVFEVLVALIAVPSLHMATDWAINTVWPMEIAA